MKRRLVLRRGLAFLLALVLLPIQYSAANSPDLIQIKTYDLFDESLSDIELLSDQEGYFIALKEAASLAGFSSVIVKNGACIFSTDCSKLSLSLSKVDSITYAGEQYYALEDLMNMLDVFLRYDGGEGLLLYNSVYKNIASLIQRTDDILGKTGEGKRFDADLLSSMGFWGELTYGVGWVWKFITDSELSALWGGEYINDIRRLLIDLMQPLSDNDKSVFETMEAVNKKLSKAAKFILKAQTYSESFKELSGAEQYFAGSDPFLFGIEGTWALRETCEAIKAVNSNKLLSLGDMLETGVYLTSALSTSELFFRSAQRALNYNSRNLGDISIVSAEAKSLISYYNAMIEQKKSEILRKMAQLGAESVISNGIESLTDAISFKVLLTVKAMKFIADRLDNTSKKVSAVMTSKRLCQIQRMFEDCYDQARYAGSVNCEEALAAQGAAMMYLKICWHSFDAFKFDKKLSSAVEFAKEQIESEIAALASYSDSFFQTQTNSKIPAYLLDKVYVESSTAGAAMNRTFDEVISVSEDQNKRLTEIAGFYSALVDASCAANPTKSAVMEGYARLFFVGNDLLGVDAERLVEDDYLYGLSISSSELDGLTRDLIGIDIPDGHEDGSWYGINAQNEVYSFEQTDYNWYPYIFTVQKNSDGMLLVTFCMRPLMEWDDYPQDEPEDDEKLYTMVVCPSNTAYGYVIIDDSTGEASMYPQAKINLENALFLDKAIWELTDMSLTKGTPETFYTGGSMSCGLDSDEEEYGTLYGTMTYHSVSQPFVCKVYGNELYLVFSDPNVSGTGVLSEDLKKLEINIDDNTNGLAGTLYYSLYGY